jgi:hypothetical protein
MYHVLNVEGVRAKIRTRIKKHRRHVEVSEGGYTDTHTKQKEEKHRGGISSMRVRVQRWTHVKCLRETVSVRAEARTHIKNTERMQVNVMPRTATHKHRQRGHFYG